MAKVIVFRLFIVLFFLQSLPLYAMNLVIQDPKSQWRKFPAHITEFRSESNITGLVSRHRVTMSIKDTLSANCSDSLEAVLTFTLPEKSVIDSLYLWIDGKPEPGYMLKNWAATTIYEDIVKRSIDPAILKMNDHNLCSLKIFPVLKRQTRKIKICYSTMLESKGSSLKLSLLNAITKTSKYAINTVHMSINCMQTDTSKINLSHIGAGLLSKQIDPSNPQNCLVTITGKNIVLPQPITITMINSTLDSSGILTCASTDAKGNKFFATCLNVEKFCSDIKNKNKKVLLLWNFVYSNYGNNTDNYYYAYSNQIEQDIQLFNSFFEEYFDEHDSFNILINDGSLSLLSDSFLGINPQNLGRYTQFFNDSLSKNTNQQKVSNTALDMIREGFKLATIYDSVTVIVVDRALYRHKEIPNEKVIEELANGYSKECKKSNSFIWIVPDRLLNNSFHLLYRKLFSKVTSLCVSALNSAQDIDISCKEITPYFSRRIYPISINFTEIETRFPHDIVGTSLDNIYVKSNCYFVGKLTNDTKFGISIRGIVDSTNITLDTQYVFNDIAIKDGNISDLWAHLKCQSIAQKFPITQLDKKNMKNIGLQYRTLNRYTSLLALEKWLADSLKLKDDEPSDFDDTLIINKDINNPTTNENIISGDYLFHSSGIIYQYTSQGFVLRINHYQKLTKNVAMNVALYSLNGRCITNLSSNIKKNKGSVVVPTGFLTQGVYVIHVKLGNTSITKNVYLF